MSISNGKRSVVLSAALRAALVPLATAVVNASGKVWESARDGFNLALVDFPEPKDAATAFRTVIVEDLKANAGTARAYISHLVWAAERGIDTSRFTMADMTNARYPAKAPALKPGQPGYVEQAAAKDREAKEKAQKAAEEAAARAAAEAAQKAAEEAAKDPKKALLHAIAADLSKLDVVGLELIAPEIARLVGEILGTETAEPVKDEDEQQQAA